MTKQYHILFVEDDPTQNQLVSHLLENQGYKLTTAIDPGQALNHLMEPEVPIDLLITDYKLADETADSLILECASSQPQVPIILITAYADCDHALEMIRAGVDEYIPKPFDKATLLFNVKKLIRRQNRLGTTQYCDALSDPQLDSILIGNSEAMLKIKRTITQVANSDTTVLITGESGTGKELVASAIHKISNRNAQPLITVNCAAIQNTLAEAEFFGVLKGAYTGADKERKGFVSEADGGTLFLDEVGELSPIIQGKLLRFLEAGLYTPVGSNRERQANVRIVAATNQNLKEMVRKNQFREDLYYRLNIIPITLPPLRIRNGDIGLLVDYFLDYYAKKFNAASLKLTNEARRKIVAYDWPGNVRQLASTIQRLVLLSSGNEISIDDLDDLDLTETEHSSEFTLPEKGIDWLEHEKDCLSQALEKAKHNKSKAAKLLGLNYKAFLYRLEKYDL